jgi:hypothetical protein
MNPVLVSLFAINYVSAWGWGSGSRGKQDQSALCHVSDNDTFNNSDTNWGVCWEAMGFKRLELSNLTAIFQPGFWERDYPEISEFCSDKANGTYCYRPQYQANDSCLDMAVVRCPEGIISSCRSNFICNEVMSQNVTCDSSVGSIFNSNYTESAQARCQAIEDVIRLPPAQNVSTTVDQQNNTLTIGQQVFGFPFLTSATVDCTYSCITSLPSGFPQPTAAMTACFNDSLPYDQIIPTTTCAGPYPPGPMTTVTETFCNSTESMSPTERTLEPTGIMTDSTQISSEVMPTSDASTTQAGQCPIDSTSSTEVPIGGTVTDDSSTIDPPSGPCEPTGSISSAEPTPTTAYY